MRYNQNIILIAPNVSKQLGGEAIKALQTFTHYKAINPNTHQITHARNRAELTHDLHLDNIHFVKEDWFDKFLWFSFVFRNFLNVWFSYKAVKLAEQLADDMRFDSSNTVIHQTGPNSPVVPRTLSKKYLNTFGPINGNIYYPKPFRDRETVFESLRRLLHMPAQLINSRFFRSLKNADLIFIAGGKRTEDSLKVGGCLSDNMVDTVDCGLEDTMFEQPRIEHDGENHRFVHYGRLVNFKCTDLVIKSLVKTQSSIKLDIIGSGPELNKCKKLVRALGLENRVKFIDWVEHSELYDVLKKYRGMVLPSIGDSNGIVVQEAMAYGLPVISLDWGGPQMLIEHGVDGYLIKPSSEDFVVDQMAQFMDEMAADGSKVEAMSIAARQKATQWRWSEVAQQWIGYYHNLVTSLANPLDYVSPLDLHAQSITKVAAVKNTDIIDDEFDDLGQVN